MVCEFVGPVGQDTHVVAAVTTQLAGLGSLFKQNLKSGADESFDEFDPLFLPQTPHQRGPPLYLLGLHPSCELRRGRSIPHRIWKHMEIGERQPLHEIKVILEVTHRFAREPDDQVGADRRIGHRFENSLDAIAIVRRRITPPHALEDRVVTRLKRQMEMRTKLAALCNQRNYPVAQLVGVERAQTYSLDRRTFGDHFQKFFEPNRRIKILPVAAQVDAGKNHFLETARMKPVERRDHTARFDATRQSARKWHDTERTELVAALLELEKSPRMAFEGDRAEFDRRPLLAQVRDHHALLRASGDGALEIVEASEPDYRVDLARTGQHVRIRLREAPGHNHTSAGIEPPRTARKSEALRVGAVGHRARIDDIDVGGFVELATFHPQRAETRLDYRRIILVDLASQGRDRKTHPALSFQRPLDESAAQHFVAAIENARLPRGDGRPPALEAHFRAIGFDHRERCRQCRMTVANLDFDSDLAGGRHFRMNETHTPSGETTRRQLCARSHTHVPGGCVDSSHVERFARRNAQAAALPDGKTMQSRMRRERPAASVDDSSRANPPWPALALDERRVIAVRHETYLLAIGLIGVDQPKLASTRADFHLGHRTQRKQRAGKLALGQHEKEV